MSREATQQSSTPGIYFRILEAFANRGCPLCHEVQRLSLRSMEYLFHERVNDGGVRAALKEARGFCNWHGWMARDLLLSNTGIAIIYKDLLDTEIQSLPALDKHDSGSPQPSPRRQRPEGFVKQLHTYLSSWVHKQSCPECQRISSHEYYGVKTLVESLGDETFSEGFARSDGLCFPHFTYALGAFHDHPNLAFLLAAQREIFQSLSVELGEFTRKRDYKFAHEPIGSEADAWIRVIELFVGRRHLFGPSRSLFKHIPYRHSWLERLGVKVASLFRKKSALLGMVVRSAPEQLEEIDPPDHDPQEPLPPDTERLDDSREREEITRPPTPNEWKQKYMELSSRAAALHHQLYKVETDRKTLEMHYAASQGELKTSKLLIEKLRKEIERFKRNQ